MSVSDVLMLIVGLFVAGLVVYRIFIEKRLDYDFSDGLEDFRKAVALVEKYAPAADQLVAIGQLEPEARRAYVVELVMSHLVNLDPDQVIGIVEWWVAERKGKEE